MLNYMLQPRHWSPRQGYATGDVLIQMINDGWTLASARRAPGNSPAPMFIVTLKRESDVLALLVLDSPAVRDILKPTA